MMTAKPEGGMKGTLRKERWYAHSPERVWVAMTDPRALAEWCMPNNMRAEVGHRFRFETDMLPLVKFSGIVECEVVECVEHRVIAYSWTGTYREPKGGGYGPMLVRWELVPENKGTRLILTQTGLETMPWLYRKMMTSGWGTMMKRWIPKVLDNVSNDGSSFEPGAIPLKKRCYKVKTISKDMVY